MSETDPAVAQASIGAVPPGGKAALPSGGILPAMADRPNAARKSATRRTRSDRDALPFEGGYTKPARTASIRSCTPSKQPPQ